MPKEYQVSSSAVHVITGRVGDDPMPCATRSGRIMTVFSIKVVDQVNVKVEAKVETRYRNTWYRIKTFDALADACLRFLHKDHLVQAQGNDMKAWGFIDATTGEPRGALELIATKVIFLDPPNINLAAMNPLPEDDIEFSLVADIEPIAVETPDLALVG